MTVRLAFTMALALAAATQPAPPPGIPEALQVQPKDPGAAAKILEGVTAREPGNARAWRLLGAARHQHKDYERAIEAYQKALAIQADPTATYNLAASYARLKESDRAFDWLAKAKATKQVDMSFVPVDPDFADLKDDARIAALLPAKSDFARPFIEDVRIVHEWQGERANDQFGWIARGIGDVDADGINEFATSAPFAGDSAAPAGRIYIYSSKSGRLLWKADGAPGERLGLTLEAAGDVNGDLIPDVVATAPGTGKAYVYSGRDGKVIRTLTAPGEGSPLSAVATAGDVNGDGHADILAGAAPRPQITTRGAGRAFVFSGKDGSVLLTLEGEREGDRFGSAVAGGTRNKHTLLAIGAPLAGDRKTGRVYVYDGLSTKPAFTIESDETGAALGAMFVALAGDVDKDTVVDVYASDFANRAKGPSTGRVYVHSGKSGMRVLTLTGTTGGEGFGTSASKAGDLDGDGHADLAVGAWQFGGAAPSGGRIYLHSGRDGRLLGTITCRTPFDTLGFDSVGIGDVDADGIEDLLVTSAYSAINGYHSGRVFIVSSGIRKSKRNADGVSPK